MDYRTKATVAEGVVEDQEIRAGIRLINYQPGNGTRYILLFTRISSKSVSELVGLMGETGWIVSWLYHASRPLVCSDRGFLHWSDVKDWFKTSKSDAVALAEVVGYVTGISASTLADVRREDLRVIEGGG